MKGDGGEDPELDPELERELEEGGYDQCSGAESCGT